VPDIPRANHRTQGPKALLGSQQNFGERAGTVPGPDCAEQP